MNKLNTILENTTFITDGGLETDLIFNKEIDLPHFAAFPLLDNPKLSKVVIDYFREYLELAKAKKTGFIIESPTWRANPDWGYALGYSEEELSRVNKKAIEKLQALKAEYEDSIENILISGCIGPRGDGYTIDKIMIPSEANSYHNLQVRAFKESGANVVTATTMTYIDEALGIVKAAQANNIPVIIAFTVETDGLLPSGETLEAAISTIDELTNGYPLHYMVNCAHPSHFVDTLKHTNAWKSRIKGVRSNASCKSHAELDNSTELDAGDKEDLGQWHKTLKQHLPELKVYGGCCGTDASHIESICNHVL